MKLFIWDLHGTLEQGNERAAIDMSNQILEKFGYRERFSESDIFRLYGLKWFKYFEYLLPHEPSDRHFELQAACFELSNSPAGAPIVAKYMTPAPHAIETLGAIAESEHNQVLLSNTMDESVPFYVEALGIGEYFNKSNAIAVNQHTRDAKQTKQMAVEGYIRGKDFDKLIVIGDSGGDMELAEAIGATGYLYAHPSVNFRSNRSDHRIRDLREVLCEL
jgi:phosphoglycolate phosphatase-like HAD superfamily hydrolase